MSHRVSLGISHDSLTLYGVSPGIPASRGLKGGHFAGKTTLVYPPSVTARETSEAIFARRGVRHATENGQEEMNQCTPKR